MPAYDKSSLVFPEMGKTGNRAADVKSFIQNIFQLNPAFARFCAGVIISAEPNSVQAKYLANRYPISKGIPMPVSSNVRICTHIKVTGVRCGSPALRGEQFCYFHQRMIRGVRTPPRSRLHPIAQIENEEAIQVSLMEVINALARNTIDVKRAELILRALNIAVRNARRARFENVSGSMIKEVPEYQDPKPANVEAAEPCADGSLTHPSGTEVPARSAFDLTSEDASAALTTRKPPTSVKPVPKERKNAAHSATCG